MLSPEVPFPRGSDFSFNPERVVILGGRGNFPLAKRVAENLEVAICNPVVGEFADGEVKIDIQENLRGRDVLVVQSMQPSPNDRIFEFLLTVDAARRSDARSITAVLPYMAYARQDQRIGRSPISTSVLIRSMQLIGVRKVMTVDLHSKQQTGIFDEAWEDLSAMSVLAPAVEDTEGITIASPDQGGFKRAAVKYATRLGARGIVTVNKERPDDLLDESKAVGMVGESVKGARIVMVDDMISTGATSFNAADLLTQQGPEIIILLATHGIFSGNSLERLSDSPIDRVFVTDTIEARDEVLNHPKIHILPIAPLLADAIRRLQSNDTLQPLK